MRILVVEDQADSRRLIRSSSVSMPSELTMTKYSPMNCAVFSGKMFECSSCATMRTSRRKSSSAEPVRRWAYGIFSATRMPSISSFA